MARQTITNGETGLQVRTDLNDNFTELYADVANLDLTVAIDTSGGSNNESVFSPMPDTTDAAGRNKINTASLTTVNACTNIGAAAVGAANRIASTEKPASDGGQTGNTVWVANWTDDDLSSDPTIVVASIFGAYDQVCNSTGSCIIACPHSMIKHSAGGHNNILGGAGALISGTTTRSGLISSWQTVVNDGSYTAALGCRDTDLDGTSWTIAAGCDGATITADNSAVFCCTSSHSVSGDGSLVVRANNSGDWSCVVGNVTNSGDYNAIFGNGNQCIWSSSFVAGQDVYAPYSHSMSLGSLKITNLGDAQWSRVIEGNDSTGSNLTLSMVQWPSGVNVTGTMTISLVGTIVGTNSVMSYHGVMGFYINGSTAFFIDSTGSGQPLYRDLTFDTSGLTWSGGTAGQVSISGSAQLLRVRTPSFTDGSTTVNWVASAEFTFTREDDVEA